MKTSWLLMPALSLGLALGGCAVVPERDYGYADDERNYVRETVIVAPAPRIEYRGYPPAANFIWIDGYWNRIGRQHDWVSGYWAPPPLHARPPQRYWRDDSGRRFEALRGRERELARAREREDARDNRDQRWNQQRNVHQREPMRERPQDERPRRGEGERTRGEAREQLTHPTSERSPLTLGERPRFRAGPRADDQAGRPERSERAQREPQEQREPREPRRELERGDDSGRDMRHQRRFPRTERE